MNIVIDATGPVLEASASLHHVALPDSIISRIGRGYTDAFYRFAAASPKEAVFSALGPDGSVVGAAVLSLEPATLSRRLFFRTPLAPHLLRRPRLAIDMGVEMLRAFAAKDRSSCPRDLAEVLAIFTRPNERSRGIGRCLLRSTEAYLAQRNIASYMVRTVDRPDNRALAFYDREGFQAAGRLHAYGTEFLVLTKHVHVE
jgi:ribosomal protein S18 acetylase RimI-like enzyme